MHSLRQFASGAALVFAVGAAPVQAELPRSCHVEIEDAAGAWHVDRKLDPRDGTPLREYDEYEWSPGAPEELPENVTLKTSLSVRARVAESLPKVFAGSDTAIDMSFYARPRTEGEKPNDPGYFYLHFYRSSDPSDRKSVFDTSLTMRMLSNVERSGNVSIRGVLSLEELLAFGTGKDVLVWNIRRRPNEVGATNPLLKGTLPVGAIRARLSRIPELRRALDRKAAKFRKECPVLEEPIPVNQAALR